MKYHITNSQNSQNLINDACGCPRASGCGWRLQASCDVITKMGAEKASSREKPETQRMRTFNHTERRGPKRNIISSDHITHFSFKSSLREVPFLRPWRKPSILWKWPSSMAAICHITMLKHRWVLF